MNQQKKWHIESLWEQYFFSSSSKKREEFDFSHFSTLFPHTYFPNLHVVKKLSPKHATKPVFFDDGEEFFGLHEYQVMQEKNGKPIYLFDNHDLALIAFTQLQEFCKYTFDIIHIDAHRDDAIFPYDITKKITVADLPELLKKTRVSDYLNVATRGKIIGNIFSYTQSFEFDAFELPKNPYILNLDLDIFGPEGTAVSLEKKIEIIAAAWKNASAVVLATSPGYFLQDDAFWLVELLSKTTI